MLKIHFETKLNRVLKYQFPTQFFLMEIMKFGEKYIALTKHYYYYGDFAKGNSDSRNQAMSIGHLNDVIFHT